MAEQYGLNSKFDIEKHKQTFINYLEVVILKDGTIEYAVPSHQMKLQSIVNEECPREKWGDYLGWLIEKTGAVCVWNIGYMGNPNAIQKRKLLQLETAGIFKREKV